MEVNDQTNISGLPDARNILLAVAIGNKGDKYESTRHNAGIWFIKKLANKQGLSFSKVSDLAAKMAGTALSIRLAHTETFVNISGDPTQALISYLRIEPASLLVVHDEVDLDTGVARFKFGGGHAGHNGLKDIARALGTKDYWRLRIGVSKPQTMQPLEDYVLQQPSKDECANIDFAIDNAIESWDLVENNDMDQAIRLLHGKKL